MVVLGGDCEGLKKVSLAHIDETASHTACRIERHGTRLPTGKEMRCLSRSTQPERSDRQLYDIRIRYHLFVTLGLWKTGPRRKPRFCHAERTRCRGFVLLPT